MPASFRVDEARNLLIGRVSGASNAQEILEAMVAVIAQSQGAALRMNTLLFVDESVELHDFDMSALVRIRDSMANWARTHRRGAVRGAVVARKAAHGVVSQLWRAAADLRPIGSTGRVFESEEEAVAWLNSPEG
jgi:hypothetical protein